MSVIRAIWYTTMAFVHRVDIHRLIIHIVQVHRPRYTVISYGINK